MSEYGVNKTDGLSLAQSILEDIHHLKCTAWCYWQVLENRCSWGLVEADFVGRLGVERAKLPYPKFYVFAHFTRFLHPGSCVLNCSAPWAVVMQTIGEAKLACVVLNQGEIARRDIFFPGFAFQQSSVESVFSIPGDNMYFVSGHSLKRANVSVDAEKCGTEIRVTMPANSICTLVVSSVSWTAQTAWAVNAGSTPLGTIHECHVSRLPPVGISVRQVVQLVAHATTAAIIERRAQDKDFATKTSLAWARFEHCRACCVLALNVRRLQGLFGIILHCAWGVANERALGPDDEQTCDRWECFHRDRASQRFDDNFDWAMFNIAWAIGNGLYYGPEDESCKMAFQQAEEHIARLGGWSKIVLS